MSRDRRAAARLRRFGTCARAAGVVALGLEVALRVHDAHVATSGHSLGAFVAGRMRVLAIGDSNTYGGDETYPKLLERRWNADADRPRLEVLNLGFPGDNTSLLRRELPHLLAAFRPDTVTYMIGSNDYWTELRPPSHGRPWVRAETWLWERSHVFRLLERGVRRVLPAPRLEVEPDMDDGLGFGRGVFRYGPERFFVDWHVRRDPSLGDDEAAGHAQLREIVALAQRAGVRFVLVTYPAEDHFFGLANRRMRAVAAETGAELVDLATSFAASCAADGCPGLMKPDRHLTPAGHERVAAALAEGLAASSRRAPGAPEP